MNLDRIYLLPYISKIQISFSLVGIFFYLFIIIIFFLYSNCIFFIKEEIFSFIFLKSLCSLIELFIDDEIYRIFFIYISQTILFVLLLLHINKCLTQKKIIEDTKDLELNDKLYIILIYLLSFFPFESFFSLQVQEMFFQNAVKIVAGIILYRHINKKINILTDRLKQQQIKAKNDVNHFMGYKENYYLKMISTINSMYLTGLFLFIIYISINIYLLYNFNEIIKFVGKFFDFGAFAFIILAQLLFFFCSNKIELEIIFKKGKLNSGFKKFVIMNVIKIFNQEDTDENHIFE